MGLLRFDPATREMILVSTHPGVSADLVLANTGWPLQVADELTQTEEPTEEEMVMLRRLDPQDYWTGS
jgi:glutaconate CoA-transferase subunit B